MKIKFLRDALTSLLILSFFFFTGCKDNPCDNKKCEVYYNASCDDGDCVCPPGISLDNVGNCSIKDLDQVTKQWTLATSTSNCGITIPQGTILIISEETSSTQQYDDIKFDFGTFPIFPTLSGRINDTDITIESQVISGETYFGSGTVSPNGKVINITLTRTKTTGQTCVFSISGT